MGVTDAVRIPEEVLTGLPDFPFAPRFHQWDGLRLAHLDEGEGRPVVFFHGEPTWSFLWRKVIPPVRDAGFRCLAPDLPGHARLGRRGRDQHDPAVARCPQGFKRRLGHVELAGQVGLDVLAPLRLGKPLGAVDRVHHPGVRDHGIAPAQLLDHRGDSGLGGGAVAHIEHR